jgi:hypothetical protein
LEVPDRLYREVARALEEKLPKEWSWRSRRVKVFDGTTVSMPDTPQNQNEFPQNFEQQEGLGFPIARLGAVISLGSGCVIGHTVVACEGKGTGEQTLYERFQDAAPNKRVNQTLDRCSCFSTSLVASRWLHVPYMASDVIAEGIKGARVFGIKGARCKPRSETVPISPVVTVQEGIPRRGLGAGGR